MFAPQICTMEIRGNIQKQTNKQASTGNTARHVRIQNNQIPSLKSYYVLKIGPKPKYQIINMFKVINN